MTTPEHTSHGSEPEAFRAPHQIPERGVADERESTNESELRRENESLRMLAHEQSEVITELMIDVVTDLKNRRSFLQDSNDAVAHATHATFERIYPKRREGIEIYRYGGDELTVLFMGKSAEEVGVLIADLAKLKQINSDTGHEGGDLALRISADALRYAQRTTSRTLPFQEQHADFIEQVRSYLAKTFADTEAESYSDQRKHPRWQQIKALGVNVNFGYADVSELDPSSQAKIHNAASDQDRWHAVKQAANELVSLADTRLFPQKTHERITELVNSLPREEAEMRLHILKRKDEIDSLADRSQQEPVVENVGRLYVELRIWERELGAMEERRGGLSFSDAYLRNYEVLRDYVTERDLVEIAALDDDARQERIKSVIESKM